MGGVNVVPKRKIATLLSITDFCNVACRFCNQYTTNGTFFPKEEIIAMIDEIVEYDVNAIILYGGEPSLHPDFIELGKYIKSKGIKSGFMSNGIGINNHNVDSVVNSFDIGCISIHGFEETHNYLTRSKTYSKTLEVISMLSERNFPLMVNTTVTSFNVEEIDCFIHYLYKRFPNIKLFRLNRIVDDGARTDKSLLLSSDQAVTLENKFLKLVAEGIPVKIGIPLENAVFLKENNDCGSWIKDID